LVIQILSAWIGFGTPAVGVLHPINAFLILALTGSLASQAWRGTRRPATSASPAMPAA
jgi:hypothetical protein